MGLLGSGSKGRSNNPKFGRGGGANPRTSVNANVKLDTSQAEPNETTKVQERYNAAIQGKMLHDQLKKNKSGKSPV
jgi:hypothetical protein